MIPPREPSPPVRHISEEEAHAEVQHWTDSEGASLISDQAAQTIASWWHSPSPYGMPFTTLSSTGRCPAAVADACDHEIREMSPQHPDRALQAEALRALKAYAEHCGQEEDEDEDE